MQRLLMTIHAILARLAWLAIAPVHTCALTVIGEAEGTIIAQGAGLLRFEMRTRVSNANGEHGEAQ